MAKRNTEPRYCSVEGCERAWRTVNLCNMHYERKRLTGAVGPAAPKTMPRGDFCRAPGCGREAYLRNLCVKHNSRMKTNGTLEKLPPNDNIGYGALHTRIKRSRGPARKLTCFFCSDRADEWAYDKSDPHVRYDIKNRRPFSMDIERYFPICVPCHRKLDTPPPRRRVN